MIDIVRLVGSSYLGCLTLSDRRKSDFPLVYVNEFFSKETGYSVDEVKGKNCRFLNESHRKQPALSVVRDSISSRTDICIDLLNVKKNQEVFVNRLLLTNITEFYILGLQHVLPAKKSSLKGNGTSSLLDPFTILDTIRFPLTTSLNKLTESRVTKEGEKKVQELVREGLSVLNEISYYVENL